jgi:hypothetical protein
MADKPKHVNGTPDCPLCEVKLQQAHPDLVKWFKEKVKPSFPAAHISWSYRDKANQEQAFLDGKSKLHYPLSAHNKCDDHGNPCAMALDLFELDFHGQASWPWGFFRDISNMNNKDACPIFWGGLWAKLGDADHMELRLPNQGLQG